MQTGIFRSRGPEKFLLNGFMIKIFFFFLQSPLQLNYLKSAQIYHVCSRVCHLCQKVFEKKSLFIQHRCMGKLNPLTCPTCDVVYYSGPNAMKKHLKRCQKRQKDEVGSKTKVTCPLLACIVFSFPKYC